MKINKTRRKSNGTISRRKYKNIHKSRKQIKRTHKKSLLRLKKYNKNNRHRRHYTRRVNRSKRGGVPLLRIDKPFNFSLPGDYSNEPYNVVAAGWGYVTKLNSVFSQKNRPEQLIIFEKNNDNDNYYIERCISEKCNTSTKKNVQDTILAKKSSFRINEINNMLIAHFITNNNKEYQIVDGQQIEKNEVSINNKKILARSLYTFFKDIQNLTDVKIIGYLKQFRTNPRLLGVLVDSIARSKTIGDDTNICFKIISENIFPMTHTDTSDQINIENQFANMLYNLCSTTIKKMEKIEKTTFGNELFRGNGLFTKLLTHYSSIRGKKFLSSILVDTDLSKLPSYNNDTEMLTFALIILVSILKHIRALPIGYKCVSSSIDHELNMKKVDEAAIKSHIFNFLCLKLICPFIGDYFMANNMNELATRIPTFIQKIANNDEITKSKYGIITLDPINNTNITSLDLFHKYANEQLSIDTLNCDITGSDMKSLETYSYNLEKSPIYLSEFEKFEKLTTPTVT